jgi:hypothetical protein
MKKVAILCSGGDVSGMNAALKRFVEYALEKKISRFHTKLGERVEYVLGLEKGNLEEDDVVKGFLQEIGDIRKEIEELERKIEALKSAETEDSQEIEGTNEEKEVTEGEGED